MDKENEQVFELGKGHEEKLASLGGVNLLIPAETAGENLKSGAQITVSLEDGRKATLVLIKDATLKPIGRITQEEATRCGYKSPWEAWEDVSLNIHPGISMMDEVAIVSVRATTPLT